MKHFDYLQIKWLLESLLNVNQKLPELIIMVLLLLLKGAQDPTASPLSTHSSSASPHHGQKGDHREESPKIIVGIGSGGNNKCEKGILEQKYKDNSHEADEFAAKISMIL